MATSAQLPAHFLAYKQKAEEQANRQQDGPRMGTTNCWGASFSFMSTDPRTSVSSTSTPTGFGSDMNYNNNDNMGFGSEQSSPTKIQRSGVSSLPTLENTKIGLMWNRFSGTIKSKVTGMDDLEVPETHSAELESKSGFPTNKQMTNVDRLKSMAAAAVRKPEIPDVSELPERPPAPQQQPQQASSPIQEFRKLNQQSSFQSSSFPSLASSQSDGSSSLESSAGSSGRFWTMGSKIFGSKANTNKAITGIGSHEDTAIGELNKNKSSSSASSYFPSSMMSSTKKVEEKKNIDIDMLKKLRDQAAGLVPQSPSSSAATPTNHHQDEHKEEEKVADTLESQIDNLEKEMGMVSTSSTTIATTPALRMDGFDDVHEAEPPKNYAEIKVSTISASGVSHMDPFVKTTSMPNKMASPLAGLTSTASNGGLSTVL